jgi:transcriptional regulator GlxA family with amidase domain
MTPYHVAFCVVPEFPLTSLSVGIDALRVANRMAGKPLFRWTVLSPDGQPIAANCGLSLIVDGRFPDPRRSGQPGEDADMGLVVSGFDPQKYCLPALRRFLTMLKRRNSAVGAVASGTHILAEAGLLEGAACTIHWENRTALIERFPGLDVRSQLFVADRGIYTCGGSSSVYDMMLWIISERAGAPIAARVAEQSLLSSIRRSEEAARRPFGPGMGTPGPLVARALEIMDRQVAEPGPIAAFAATLGVSQRQLERQFRAELGETPSACYRRLRIEHAARLILQTDLSMAEVGIACGFASSAHFSRTYRRVLGRTPSADRRRYRHRTAEWPAAIAAESG